MNTSQFLATLSKGSAEVLPPCDKEAREYYNFPNRAYHTWEHVNHVYDCAHALLCQSQKLNSLATFEKEALALAISWHDIFQGPNHELASAAKLYHERPNETSALAARLIVDGTTHLSPPDMASLIKAMGVREPASRNFETLVHAIHDADLMILSETTAKYDAYARGIVVEALAFGLNLTDYFDRRIQFLRHIQDVAQRNLLFKTTAAQILNPAVLENVHRELEQLG